LARRLPGSPRQRMNQQLFTFDTDEALPSDLAPAISVLIRTTGRPSLAAAIESVRRQGFADWEIVVLNAGGQPIEALPRLLSGVRGQALEPGGRVERSRAANLLLDAARGPLALFLDDDDTLLPDHLGKLAAALEQEPNLVAAYGDVVCMTASPTGEQHPVHTFQSEFDPAALQLQNYLPIHAVLFRISAVRSPPPCRFDTALELFEDWDFWLQLAAKGPFRRVPGVSAVYALEAAQGSGHTHGPLRQAMLDAVGARQLARWKPEDVARLMQRDAQRSDLLNAATQQAAAQQEMAEAAQQEIAQVRSVLEDSIDELRDSLQQVQRDAAELSRALVQQREALQGQIAEIHASSSWRLTRPLRVAGRVARQLAERMRARLVLALVRTAGSQLRRHGPLGLARRVPYFLRHRHAYLARLGARPGTGNPFSATAPPLRNMPLHPDIEGAGEPFDVQVSVVIPTLNAGPEFAWLLRKLRTQRSVRAIEIVIVDSGSRDGTVALARAAGATVVEIAPSEFTHSHARNLGAQAAGGDYLLFMVQDAFPIGDHWIYAMLRSLRDPDHAKLAAVSCSEFSRSDSDVMYDAMIDTHYRFLGCLEQDRIGNHQGDDHMSLRSQGQLSDVACLIGRELFLRYRYHGDYAEDLDLGIRLIKDGWQVGMLASVKVVHSHNRPAYYYLKRSFVDVEFLVGMFDDFTYPHCESLPGLVTGIVSAAGHVSRWLPRLQGEGAVALTAAQLASSMERWRIELQTVTTAEAVALGDARLEAYIRELSLRYPAGAQRDPVRLAEARRFADSFAGRLAHFVQFALQVYDPRDPVPRHELAGAVCKTLAATAGSALAFYCLDHRKPGDAAEAGAQAIHTELTAGV
jgi:glycosyltransferase involved in cell wall biosynthesis